MVTRIVSITSASRIFFLSYPWYSLAHMLRTSWNQSLNEKHVIERLTNVILEIFNGTMANDAQLLTVFRNYKCIRFHYLYLWIGFNDSHDAVVCSTLKCVTALTEIHFFRRGTLCTLFSQALHLLKHRNTWIRVETAHFLACVARNVPLAIKECRLRPFLKPFLECPAVQIEKAEVRERVLHLCNFAEWFIKTVRRKQRRSCNNLKNTNKLISRNWYID